MVNSLYPSVEMAVLAFAVCIGIFVGFSFFGVVMVVVSLVGIDKDFNLDIVVTKAESVCLSASGC